MIINKADQLYSTTDLSLASTISLFFPLDSIDRTNPTKISFNFKREKSMDDLLEKFWRSELLVEPQKYFSQIKFLKSRIYEK